MSRDLIRLMQSLFPTAQGDIPEVVWQPSMDIYRSPKGWLLKFDLAGVRLEDVELYVQDRCLTLRGVRRDWIAEQGCHYYRMEISYNRFERRVELPCCLELASLATEYCHGMLLVHIQTEAEK